MATAIKRNVRQLRDQSPVTRRLGKKGVTNFGDLFSALIELAQCIRYDVLNYVLSAGAVALATTVQRVKSVSTITFVVNGVLKSKAGTDNLWILAATPVVGPSKFQKYVLCLDASGAASVVPGAPAGSAAAVVLPFLNDAKYAGVTPVAILQVATDGVTTFTPNTTALNAAGVTSTFSDGVDAALYPAAPVSLA